MKIKAAEILTEIRRFLGALAKLRKATISFVMCPSVRMEYGFH
jgi:hypothetical protein